MGITEFKLDSRGRFVRDVFFYLKLTDFRLRGSDWKNDWITKVRDHHPGAICLPPSGLSDDQQAMFALETNIKWNRVNVCRTSRDHRALAVPEKAMINVYGDVLTPIVHAWDAGLLLFQPDAVASILESKLNGAEFGPVEVVENHSRIATKDIQLRCLRRTKRTYFRPSRVYPSQANRCFNCGFEPLICPDCGARLGFMDCPQCEEDLFAVANDHRGAADRRIRIEPFPSEDGNIVEVAEWSGEDFLGKATYPVVTRRVLDFFQLRHIGPFEAYPLRANIEGVSKEKLTLLERAKKPI